MGKLEELYLQVLDRPEWDHIELWDRSTYSLLDDILKTEGIGLLERLKIRRILKRYQKELKKEKHI